MKSSKWMIGLVAVVLMLALAPSSYAQIQLQLFNTPSVGEINTNHHANTADVTSVGAGLLVSGQLIAASSLTTTQFTLTFPGPITASPNAVDGTFGVLTPAAPVPSALEAIRIEGATGLFASVTAIASINYVGQTITITLPGFPACAVAIPGCNPPGGNSSSGSFRISGIRLDVAGKNAPLTVSSASLSSSANNYIGPTSFPTLISALGVGLGNFSQSTLTGASNQGTALMFANQSGVTAADGTASVLLTEGFASAWRTATQTATTGVGANITNGSNILLTIAGLPAGVTANLSRIIVPGNGAGATAAVGVALTSATLTSGAPTTTLSFTTTAGASCAPGAAGACQNGGANPDLNAIENVAFDIILSGAPTTVPVPSGSITLAATMTPNSTSGLGSGVPTTTGGYPRFTTLSTTVTIGSIGQATTTLLIPFVARVGTQFDTGIAIANTTKDPFGGAASGGAVRRLVVEATRSLAGGLRWRRFTPTPWSAWPWAGC